MSQLGISQRTQGPPREGGWGVIRALAEKKRPRLICLCRLYPFVDLDGLGQVDFWEVCSFGCCA